MMRGWQSETIDGPEGGWSCAFRSGYIAWLQWPPHSQLLDVVWCSAIVVVVVAAVVVVVVVVGLTLLKL